MSRQTNPIFGSFRCSLRFSRISRTRAGDGLARQRRRLCRVYSGWIICAKMETQQPPFQGGSRCWAILQNINP